MKAYLANVRPKPVHSGSSPQAQETARQMREGIWISPMDGENPQAVFNTQLGGASVHMGRGSWKLYKGLVLRPFPRTTGASFFDGPLAMLGDHDTKIEPIWTPTGIAATDHLIEVYRNRTVLKDLWLSHGSRYAGASIYVHDCSDVTIENIYMDAAQVAIYLKNVARVRITGLNVRGLNSTGFLMEHCEDCSIGQCILAESATSDEVIMDAACNRNVIVGNDFGLTGVINGASLGVGNRPVLGDVSLNVCGAVT